MQIIISINQQKLHLYSDGNRVADTPVATGVPAHPTPHGVFTIIEKSRYHYSNIYSQARMPYMQRITWSGVALHEGGNLGHPASHGCIRLSHDFAVRLWALTRLGARVIIARPELRPEAITDWHLFVHKVAPAKAIAEVKAAPAAKFLTAAAVVESDKTVEEAGSEAPDDTALVYPAVDPPSAAPAAAISAEAGGIDPHEAAPVADPPPMPLPPSRPAAIAHVNGAPISILVSGRDKTIYVRQEFAPLLRAPVVIEHPEQPLGTHVFTALDYLDDGAAFRWNVVSLPRQQLKSTRQTKFDGRSDKRRDRRSARSLADDDPGQMPQRALARIAIPEDTLDQISQLIVPGSSLIVSDQGLGDETGKGTGFIAITH